ncbi:MAG: hypothetical protein Ct9H300mP21_07560 [Pseudomonadota bacterium]|nr:MAG: hypothetical protein Ct9H300mP21_07560 [Pseudomonadota bacterium]
MGFVVIAAGTSVPDTALSVISAREKGTTMQRFPMYSAATFLTSAYV